MTKMEKLHVRYLSNGRQVAPDPSRTVADVYFNDSVGEIISHQTSSRQLEGVPLVCIHWDHTTGSLTPLSITLVSTLNTCEQVFQSLSSDRDALHSLIRESFESCGQRLVAITLMPLTFNFVYGERAFKRSEIKNLISLFMKKAVPNTADLNILIDRGREGDAKMCHSLHHQFGVDVETESNNGLCMDENDIYLDNEAKMKFALIDEKIASQKAFMEEHFKQLREQTKVMMETLSHVLAVTRGDAEYQGRYEDILKAEKRKLLELAKPKDPDATSHRVQDLDVSTDLIEHGEQNGDASSKPHVPDDGKQKVVPVSQPENKPDNNLAPPTRVKSDGVKSVDANNVVSTENRSKILLKEAGNGDITKPIRTHSSDSDEGQSDHSETENRILKGTTSGHRQPSEPVPNMSETNPKESGNSQSTSTTSPSSDESQHKDTPGSSEGVPKIDQANSTRRYSKRDSALFPKHQTGSSRFMSFSQLGESGGRRPPPSQSFSGTGTGYTLSGSTFPAEGEGHTLSGSKEPSTGKTDASPTSDARSARIMTMADIKERDWMEDARRKDSDNTLLELLKKAVASRDIDPSKYKLPIRVVKKEDEQRTKLKVIEAMQNFSSAESVQEQKLWSGVKNALEEVADDKPLRGQGLDTVLCLDTSGSISQEAFQEMKDLVLKFINGVEDIAEKYDIEENIGIVTFGGTTRVLHPLTNDYTSLRDSLDLMTRGGCSPLLQALTVAISCTEKGSVFYMGSVRVTPRILIFTDGKSTDIDENSEDDLEPSEEENIKMMAVAQEMSSSDFHTDIANPVVWIPTGQADRNALRSLALLCKGELVDTNDLLRLCSYQRLKVIASKILMCMQELNLDMKHVDSFLQEAIPAFGGDVSLTEKAEIAEILKSNLESSDIKATDQFDNLTIQSNLPPLGSRVVRGPDWQWRNQDSSGPGTIINHDRQDKWLWVLWDGGERNVYRYGFSEYFDVLLVDDQPRKIPLDQRICVGVQVERGPDWQDSNGNQDGGPGSVGSVIRKQRERVKVRWENGNIHQYRFGEDNKYDLIMRDPTVCLARKPSSKTEADTKLKEVETKTEKSEEQVVSDAQVPFVWQRLHEKKGWENYTQAENQKLMAEYRKRSLGSCLITRNGESYRVSFKNRTERCIADNKLINIRKYPDESLK